MYHCKQYLIIKCHNNIYVNVLKLTDKDINKKNIIHI